ncbi:MAG: GntR family transcriptional regulator [Clostridia bacterium]|nr:GntR family transcriptional regulator [Clostridia bacterium]
MFQLNYGDRRPVYEQIKEKIKELVINGVLKENEKIPSVRELATILAINPNTIQKAYHELEQEGFIYSLRAKGSFVAPKESAIRKNGTEELMSELKIVVSKLKFLNADYEELKAILDKEFKKED